MSQTEEKEKPARDSVNDFGEPIQYCYTCKSYALLEYFSKNRMGNYNRMCNRCMANQKRRRLLHRNKTTQERLHVLSDKFQEILSDNDMPIEDKKVIVFELMDLCVKVIKDNQYDTDLKTKAFDVLGDIIQATK